MNSCDVKLDLAPALPLLKGVDEKKTLAPAIGTPPSIAEARPVGMFDDDGVSLDRAFVLGCSGLLGRCGCSLIILGSLGILMLNCPYAWEAVERTRQPVSMRALTISFRIVFLLIA